VFVEIVCAVAGRGGGQLWMHLEKWDGQKENSKVCLYERGRERDKEEVE